MAARTRRRTRGTTSTGRAELLVAIRCPRLLARAVRLAAAAAGLTRSEVWRQGALAWVASTHPDALEGATVADLLPPTQAVRR